MPANQDEPEIMRRIREARERRGSTYMGQTQDLDDYGGRYAKVSRTVVTGTPPTPLMPQQPPTSPWAVEPIGPEAPIGYCVDEQVPTGEVHEQAASRVAVDEPADGRSVKFKRRF